jgi:hypothetical protein
MMNPKFRLVYLFLGFNALIWSVNYILTAFPVINSATILLIVVPVSIFFLLAYRVWPIADNHPKQVRMANKH